MAAAIRRLAHATLLRRVVNHGSMSIDELDLLFLCEETLSTDSTYDIVPVGATER